MNDSDQIIEKIATLVESREKYQLFLGKYALKYRRIYGGLDSLKQLAEELKERHGLSISYKTLHNYAWVEEKLGEFEIPEDVPYRVRQKIAGTSNPKEWIDKIMAGATSKEIYEGIQGVKPEVKLECPNCHKLFLRNEYLIHEES